MSINFDKNEPASLMGSRSADLRGIPGSMRGEETKRSGMTARNWLIVLVAALFGIGLAYLVMGREERKATKPAFPLHAVQVRKGPEHMKLVRFEPATKASDPIRKVMVDVGGSMVGRTYIPEMQEVRQIVHQDARDAVIVVDPDGGENQSIAIPEACDPARIKSQIGRDFVVNTEHWRWTGGRESPIGRVVHAIDEPGLFEKICGIPAIPRKEK